MARANTRNFSSILRAPGFLTRGVNQIGIRVINKTGSSIATDKLVVVSGFDSTTHLPKIVLADADSAGLSGSGVYVTHVAIADGAEGDVFKGGISAATLNTNSVSAVGDPVYLSTTAGGFTATAPSATNSVVQVVGYVLVKSATVGKIQWNVLSPTKLGSNEFQTATVGGTVDAVTLDTGGAASTIEIAPNVLHVATGTISSANITGTSSGQLGHANGVVLVTAAGAGKIIELVSAVVSLHFGVAAYGGGGNTTINISGGGAALTGLVSNANLVCGTANKIVQFVPLSTVGNAYTDNNGIALVSASAPTANTATGTLVWQVIYRQITW